MFEPCQEIIAILHRLLGSHRPPPTGLFLSSSLMSSTPVFFYTPHLDHPDTHAHLTPHTFTCVQVKCGPPEVEKPCIHTQTEHMHFSAVNETRWGRSPLELVAAVFCFLFSSLFPKSLCCPSAVKSSAEHTPGRPQSHPRVPKPVPTATRPRACSQHIAPLPRIPHA